jgi:hypothetical protein
MTKYGKLASVLIGIWFVIELAASGLHVFKTGPNAPPLAFGLAAGIPLLLFLGWFAASAGFREFAMGLNPRVLTWVQSWRLDGFVFLVLATYGILPRLFAFSAGWGDIFIGATAVFAGLKLASPDHRGSFIVWQLLGIADLVNAIAMGTLAHVIDPRGIQTDAMTVLPMSLIPTFGVPLFMMLHIICIAQARRWPARRELQIRRPTFSEDPLIAKMPR